MKPIFLLSLPRAGSTLLQRILMSHSEINSVAEPHFILPLVHSIKKEGTLTYYSHLSSYQATRDMIKNFPNGIEDYYRFIREFSLNVYSNLTSSDSQYFVDKTPRYFWIIPELKAIFPEAKFIFLFRNPIQIYGSIITTFEGGSFRRNYEFDSVLKEGFNLLSEGHQLLKDNSVAINYEELIQNPKPSLERILNYLDLSFEDSMLEDFSEQNLRGAFVDPTGVKLYKKIDSQPLMKWREVFTSRFRKRVALKFLSKIDNESLNIQGYSRPQIEKEIKHNKTKANHNFLFDIFHFYKSKLILRFDLNLFYAKNMEWSKDKYLC